MITVIKENKEMREKCTNCNRLLAYEKEDIYRKYFGTYLFHEGYVEYIKCPKCGKEIEIGVVRY